MPRSPVHWHRICIYKGEYILPERTKKMRKQLVSVLASWIFLVTLCAAITVTEASTQEVWTIAVCEDLPPFHYVDESGSITGLHIEMINQVAAVKGASAQFIVYPHASEAVAALKNREVDFVLGSRTDGTGGLADVVSSEVLSTSTISAFVRNDRLEQVLDGQPPWPSVAFELGTVNYSQIAHFSPSSYSVYGNQRQLYQALKQGRADVAVGSRSTLMYLIEKDNAREQFSIINSNVTRLDYSLLIRAGDTVRLSIVNDGINAVRTSSFYDGLLNKWMIDIDKRDMQRRISVLLWSIGIGLGAAGIIFTVSLYTNRRLKYLVAEKTGELNQKVQELEEASDLRNRLVEHISGGTLLVGADGKVLLANPAAKAMAGLPADASPDSISDLPIFSDIWERIAPATEEERAAPALLTQGMGADRRTFRYQYHPVGANRETVLTVEDVTREEQIKEEAFEERKNQTLNRIIAGVAHEIKNPLTTIRNYSALIERKGNSPEFQKAFHEYVPKEVDRISRMIETLINYARPPREQKTRIQISELVKDSVALSYLSSKRGIEVHYQVPEDLWIYGRADQIRQALINLLINSIEAVETKMAAREKPGDPLQIRISGFRTGCRVILEIYDQGSGMSEEDIRQCTDPFFTTKRHGTGMGLALTRQYIRENGGQLEIESVLGEYTRMKMIFEEALT